VTKQVHLDRLAQLPEDDLREIVKAVEQAIVNGNGIIAREFGHFRCVPTATVVIQERESA
jgi:hypothetical protein